MQKVTSKDGTAIAFDRVGDPPPIIVVDGAFVYRAIDQFPVQLAEILAPRFTVAHYEQRGRGTSGDSGPYAVEREGEDLQAVIDAVGGPACVLGRSSAPRWRLRRRPAESRSASWRHAHGLQRPALLRLSARTRCSSS